MCIAHVLMRFCHWVDRSFACKAKEVRHVRIDDNKKYTSADYTVKNDLLEPNNDNWLTTHNGSRHSVVHDP